MPLDGDGFHVEIETLEAAARRMGEVAADQQDFELRSLCGDAEVYGDAGLRDALMDFCVRWSTGIDALADRATQLGAGLGKAAESYREAEHANTGRLRVDPAMAPMEGEGSQLSKTSDSN